MGDMITVGSIVGTDINNLNTKISTNKSRSEHTGTQLASTISDFTAAVDLIVPSGSTTTDIKTSAYTAVNGDFVPVDTLTNGAIIITLPIGVEGAKVGFTDIKSNWDVANLTVAPTTGESIMGLAVDETLVVSTKNLSFELMFLDNNWRLV